MFCDGKSIVLLVGVGCGSNAGRSLFGVGSGLTNLRGKLEKMLQMIVNKSLILE